MLATPELIPIPYLADSIEWFAVVKHLPQAIWLDSGRPGSDYGRFDIISAAPALEFETWGEVTTISGPCAGESMQSNQDPFQLVQQYLHPTNSCPDIPFVGGALGYFSYDLGRRLEALPQQAIGDISLPDMAVGIYPWAILQDHQKQAAWLVINEALVSAYNFSEIRRIVIFHDS